MNSIFFAALLALVTGCVASDFEPQTIEGAQCKSDCAESMQLCNESSYTCERAYALCIEACIDVDVIARKGNRP